MTKYLIMLLRKNRNLLLKMPNFLLQSLPLPQLLIQSMPHGQKFIALLPGQTTIYASFRHLRFGNPKLLLQQLTLLTFIFLECPELCNLNGLLFKMYKLLSFNF